MAGGWPGPGSLSFHLSQALGAASSSLPGGPRRAVQGDAGLGDDGLPAKPRKSARFPLKAAITASVLATTGDTVAQLFDRYKKRKALEEKQQAPAQGIVKGVVDGASALVNEVWYEVLDHFMPVKNLTNLSLKVVANQVILGPIVISIVFAWNKLWEGRLEQLPELYRTRAVKALLDGWKFWIPASVLNFGLVPLQARVAFMSSCSIFWNFYLSNTMTASKAIALPTRKSE